jgi:hypothetical protein
MSIARSWQPHLAESHRKGAFSLKFKKTVAYKSANRRGQNHIFRLECTLHRLTVQNVADNPCYL